MFAVLIGGGAVHILGYSNTEPRNPPGYPFPFPLVPGWFSNQSQELKFQRHVNEALAKADLRVKQVAIVQVGRGELVCNGREEFVVFVFVWGVIVLLTVY